ncbi:hypothetical protein ABK040_004453 [Willaertia magna]
MKRVRKLEDHKNEKCIVCLSSVAYPIAEINNCQHRFCLKCIQNWMNRCTNKCPTCKKTFVKLKVYSSKDKYSTKRVLATEESDNEEENESDVSEAEEEKFDALSDSEEEEDDANASDADENGNLAGFVDEHEDEKSAIPFNDESFVVTSTQTHEEDEELPLSQLSFLEDEVDPFTPSPKRKRQSRVIMSPNKSGDTSVISIPSVSSSSKSPAKVSKIINVVEDDDDEVTEILNPNEIQRILDEL